MKEAPFDPRISRNKRRRRVWITAVATIALTAAWIFRPHWHPDASLVEPRLLALQKPYREVKSDTYFDEGSVGIRITDAAGRSESFFIPYRDLWQKVYLSTPPHPREDQIPVSNHAATLQELAAILSDHCDDLIDYSVLYRITGRLGDGIRMKLKRDDLQDWWKNR